MPSAFSLFSGYLQVVVEQSGRTKSLTVLVGSIGEVPAFGLALTFFAGLLWMARNVVPSKRGASGATVALESHNESR